MPKSKHSQRKQLRRLLDDHVAQADAQAPSPILLTPAPPTAGTIEDARAWLDGEYDSPPSLSNPFEEYMQLTGPGAPPLRFAPEPHECPPPEPPVPFGLSRDALENPYAPLTTEQKLTLRVLQSAMSAARDSQEALYDGLHGVSTARKIARRILQGDSE